MKTRKRILSGLLTLSVCAALSTVAFAASESIDGGSGSWYGGIDKGEQKIYSKVWDHKVDGRRYTVTVWVVNDNGAKECEVKYQKILDLAFDFVSLKW